MSDRSQYYKEWYAKNKESISRERSEKYKNDPKFKEKHKASALRYYWLKKRRARPFRESFVDVEALQPNEIADVIISNEDDIRCDMTVPVPMFYPSALSKSINRSVQTLRLWSLKGHVPEATYRNRINYRLYTKDQLKVYVRHYHLLRLRTKNFSNHPYFVEVKKGLDELEPDGIQVMHKDRWRFSNDFCEWCKSDPSLEYYDGKEWKKVPCFECRDPYDITGRIETEKQEVSAYCPFCDLDIREELYIVGKSPVIVCGTCGTRAKDVKVIG